APGRLTRKNSTSCTCGTVKFGRSAMIRQLLSTSTDKPCAVPNGVCPVMNLDLDCDLVLFVAVDSELEQLKTAARILDVRFERRTDDKVGEYYRLGVLGSNRVLAAKTRMGSHDYRGSATQGHLFRAATTATGIIQIGMGF